MKVLVTCPPMLGMLDVFVPRFRESGIEVVAAEVSQQLSEEELLKCVPEVEGWIIGDDPATRAVFEAGQRGHLRAAVKWGVGVDNVDFDAARDLGIPVANTPGMFGAEVADVALGYLIGLSRELFAIDRAVRGGDWAKPRGRSLAGKRVALVGFGDIGRALARRLLALEMQVAAYDPVFEAPSGYSMPVGLEAVEVASWPQGIEQADFLVFTCALTSANRHMLDAAVLDRSKPGLCVVNVSRGPLIDEPALAEALELGRVRAAALDVFEEEPLACASPLRELGARVVFGSHNASNTEEAVLRASYRAIDLLCGFLGVGPEARASAGERSGDRR
ncbi:MAG: phosphoglycerate dehydrogenase [Deltaproteobacteria bacterium]|nr:phosphoglycerate dehydrogenase [Deltaproteobacteria bacterium]